MISVLLAASAAFKYPLLLGLNESTAVSEPSALADPENLPQNLCIIVIDKFENDLIETAEGLAAWAGNGARDACQKVGKVVEFNEVDSDVFNIVNKMRSMYTQEKILDTSTTCPCKIRDFKEGIAVVRILDNEVRVLNRITERLPPNCSLAFVASTSSLFVQL